jgi:hypothetical protein
MKWNDTGASAGSDAAAEQEVAASLASLEAEPDRAPRRE